MKNRKIKRIVFALSVILVVIIAIRVCYTKEKLSYQKPTNKVFNANIEQVKNAIINGLGNYQIQCTALYSKEDYENDIFNTDIRYDALLISLCDIESKIYFRFGKPLPYWVEFHIHLDSISESKTKVEVFTLSSEICIGGIPFGDTGHGYSHMKKVPPSTIEEYEILLTIGKYLGEKDMPPCNYPKKYLKYLKSQREKEKYREYYYKRLKQNMQQRSDSISN